MFVKARNYPPQRESEARRRLRLRAVSAVSSAIRAGRLPRLRPFVGQDNAVHLTCVVCLKQRASCWDHRDYTKPLDVQPVCGGCNYRLPPANVDLW